MIEKFDYFGRGIIHIDGKITFVENALPTEKVEVKITREEKKYNEAVVSKFISKSDIRVDSKCPFFEECGGCQLRNLSYNDTISYKKGKVIDILNKNADILIDPKVIKSKNKDYYRNKVELKVQDGKVGYFKKGSHDIIEIDRCLNAEKSINSLILNIGDLNIKNGDITIKTNYLGEIILIIKSNENPNVDIDHLTSKNKLVGIIYNDKIIYGSDHFIECINDMLFKESYNSFFQINRNVTEELFNIINKNISSDDIVADLCSGVGTLSIIASLKAKKVYGLEIVSNSVRDSLINKQMNKRDNIEFIEGDAFKLLKNISNINTIIIDPPRSGISKDGIKNIIDKNVDKIIYISCNPLSLARDLNILKDNYQVKKSYILDMFCYTYHCESIVVLERR